MNLRAEVNTDKNEKWFEGDGSERVRRHAVNEAGLAFDGYDRNARGELSEGTAKICFRER